MNLPFAVAEAAAEAPASRLTLSPARVIGVSGRAVTLDVLDTTVDAMLALAVPYQPAVGDVVLAIGQTGDWYVIGVLRGSGATTLTVPGDLRLQAPAGKIELTSGDAVVVRAPAVSIGTDRLTVVAKIACETFQTVTRRAAELMKVSAGILFQKVAGLARLDADKIVERATTDVHIDGQTIHLA